MEGGWLALTSASLARHSASPLFYICLFAVYMLTPLAGFASGDVIGSSYLPFALLLHHNVYLGHYILPIYGPSAYFVRPVGGHIVSAYPIGTSLTVLPLYSLFVLLGNTPTATLVPIVAKVAAATLAVLSVYIFSMVLAAAGVRSAWVTWASLVILAFGTETFSISSQGLWQHTGAEFWLVILLFFLILLRNRGTTRYTDIVAVLAGFAGGMAVLCRPPDIILEAPLAIWLAIRNPRAVLLAALGAILPLGLMVAYNEAIFGSAVSSGYGVANSYGGLFTFPLWLGVAGNLFSPSKGWLMYEPWLVLSIGLVVTGGWRKLASLPLVTGIGVLSLLLLYSLFYQWPGGWVFGPRYSTDASPFMVFLGAIALDEVANSSQVRWRFIGLVSSVFLGVWSICLQFLGAYVPGGSAWNTAARPNTFSAPLWTIASSEPFYYMHALLSSFHPILVVQSPKITIEHLQLIDKPFIYDPGTPVERLTAGTLYHGTALITNHSATTLPAFPARDGLGAVHFSYHVWTSHGIYIFDGVRTALLESLPPGDSEKVYFVVDAPSKPGRYTFVFTLVQEGIAWFQSGEGEQNAFRLSLVVRH